MRRLVVIAALVTACGTRSPQEPQEKQPDPPPTVAPSAAFALDVERICQAEERSGALQEEENRRSMVVAMWLGENLETQQARDLLGELGRLPPADKGARLREAARQVGLDGCPTAEAWGG